MADIERRTISVIEVDRSRSDGSKGTARVGVKDSDNKWYSCFDAKLWPRLEAGASLNCEVKTNGKYTNIVGILGTGASANGTAPSEAGRERRIQAECALRAAVDTVRALPLHEDQDNADFLSRTALTIAGVYLDWLLANDGSARPTDDLPF